MLTLEKEKCVQRCSRKGKWLGTISNAPGCVVKQVWRDTEKELDDWFADEQAKAENAKPERG